jgi:hypothetical protein
LTVFIVNCELTRARLRELGELRHVERLVGGRVAHGDADDVVGHAEHAAALDDRIHLRDALLEGVDRRPVLEHQLDVDDDLEAAVDGRRVDLGVEAANRAGRLERPHAAQTGRRRQVDARGELDVRQPPVRLKVAQDCAIQAIREHIRHHVPSMLA